MNKRALIALGVFVFGCALAYPGPPARAPSLSAASTKASFVSGNLQLLRNRGFMLLCMMWTVQAAIIVTWQTLIDEFLDHDFSISQVALF